MSDSLPRVLRDFAPGIDDSGGVRVLAVIGGGIAALRGLETLRLLVKQGFVVDTILTRSAGEFITPLAVMGYTGGKCRTALFVPEDESEMSHIALTRRADVMVVLPATANLLAKMAHGIADDLASTCLLVTRTPIVVCPAMNVAMWEHATTQRNLRQLASDGVAVVEPDVGEMACGEYGRGHLAAHETILQAVGGVSARLGGEKGALRGKTVVVTAGPTVEAIDPVRFMSNASSGKQGYAVAIAAAQAGARVRLISGKVDRGLVMQAEHAGVERIGVSTAQEMHDAVHAQLPADIVICVAAVCDWRVESVGAHKTKKSDAPPSLRLVENPDILASVAQLPAGQRPGLVIGFCLETENIEAHARAKLMRKNCDWLVTNVHTAEKPVLDVATNEVGLLRAPESVIEWWPLAPKQAIAVRLIAEIAASFAES